MNVFQNRRQTRRTYNFLSRWYDFISGPAESRARRQAVTLLNIQCGDTVLDIGCGTGSSAIEMMEKVSPGGSIIALDLSSQMLRVAQRKLQQNHRDMQVGLFCGDAIALPLPVKSVGRILISFTLELFEDVEISMVLSECRRVLRAGGRLCVLSMSKCRPGAVLLKPYGWLHKHMPAWFDCQPILLRQTLEQHGFKVMEARESSLFGLPVETVLVESAP